GLGEVGRWIWVRLRGRVAMGWWGLWQARASCLRLLEQLMRAAASRTFWTAGKSRPIRMAMMAMTTSSSIRVNPRTRPQVVDRTMKTSRENMTRVSILAIDHRTGRAANAGGPDDGSLPGRIRPEKGIGLVQGVLLSLVSPPWVVLSARQTSRLMELGIQVTWPSQKAALTPPGLCRLRAADILGNCWLLR